MNEQGTLTRSCRRDAEAHVLNRIVDAILDAETLLQNATVEEWRRQLIVSCRRQKQVAGAGQARLAETC